MNNQRSLSTLNTTTEVRPLSKAPNPQLLPGRNSNMAAHCSRCVFTVCVCVFTAVCVHLNGFNAEHKFQLWVTTLGHTYHFTFTKVVYVFLNKWRKLNKVVYIFLHKWGKLNKVVYVFLHKWGKLNKVVYVFFHFLNEGPFKASFVKKFKLKDGSATIVHDPAAPPEEVSLTLYIFL